MWKALVLPVLLIFISTAAPAYGAHCSKEGDPGLFFDFGEETRDVIAGETVIWYFAPANFGPWSAYCADDDTFCVSAVSSSGWLLSGDPVLGSCEILPSGTFWHQDIEVQVPCDALACDYDTIIVTMHFCNTDGVCDSLCVEGDDCEDPNWYNDNPYYSADTVVLHVVEAPPSLYILQDSIYFIAQGQAHAYVPFSICNGDPCATPADYSYIITSVGPVPGTPPFPQSGSIVVGGGECENVYAAVDADSADVHDTDTLTIIAWDAGTGTVYDTCVQLAMVLEDF
jgi:hypothetical protein